MTLMINPRDWFDLTTGLDNCMKGMMIDILAVGDLCQGVITSRQLALRLAVPGDESSDPDSQFRQALSLLSEFKLIRLRPNLDGFDVLFPGMIAGELTEWLTWWNRLRDEGLVCSGYKTDKISSGVRNAWRRVQNSGELQELLADREQIEQQIRLSSFARKSWFTLEKLFGGRNKSSVYIVEELLRGTYRDEQRAVSPSSIWGSSQPDGF